MKVLGIVKVFEQLGIGIGIYCIISYKLRLFSATPYFGYTNRKYFRGNQATDLFGINSAISFVYQTSHSDK